MGTLHGYELCEAVYTNIYQLVDHQLNAEHLAHAESSIFFWRAAGSVTLRKSRHHSADFFAEHSRTLVRVVRFLLRAW